MKLNQHKILDYANRLNPLIHALAGGGGNSLLDLCDLSKTSTCKNPHYFYESLDCFDFLQKSRNDGVGKIVIARALPEAIHISKSFCFVLLSQKVESLYPLDSNLQSKVALIRSYIIYFSHCLKSFALDTSLRINATLSMTRWGEDSRILDCHALPKASLAMTNRPYLVILRAIARSIHFGESRIARDSLTLSESMRLRFTRFAHLIFHTTHKGIKMNT